MDVDVKGAKGAAAEGAIQTGEDEATNRLYAELDKLESGDATLHAGSEEDIAEVVKR